MDRARRDRPEFHTDIARLRAGGVGGQFWSVYVPVGPAPSPKRSSRRWNRSTPCTGWSRRTREDLAIALHGGRRRGRASRPGRIASLIGIEGGHSLASSLGVLRAFARLGVRYVTLTHNNNTSWADSAADEPAVRRPQRRGPGRGRARCSASACSSTCPTSRPRPCTPPWTWPTAPVIFSHSSARALCDHRRNVPDDVLSRLRANGGVCMATFVPPFVSAEVGGLGGGGGRGMGPAGPAAAPYDWPRAPRPGEELADPPGTGIWRDDRPARRSRPWLAANPRPDGDDRPGGRPRRARPRGGRASTTSASAATTTAATGCRRAWRTSPATRGCSPSWRARGWSHAELEKLTGRNILRVLRAAEEHAAEPMWPRFTG